MDSNNDKTNQILPEKRATPRRSPARLVMALSAIAMLGLGFWLLWNLAGVPLVKLPALTYWQGLGAMVLSALLLRLAMIARRRHRGSHPNRPATDGCAFSNFHCGKGPSDI